MIWYLLLAIPLVYGLAIYILAHCYVHPKVPTPPTPSGLVDDSVITHEGPIPIWTTQSMSERRPECDTVIVMVHGYRGDRSSWKDAAHDLVLKGYEVVIPELPGHGANPDRKCGFVSKEHQVVLQVVAWARSMYSAPPKVVLMGISMGGAACWLASQVDPSIDAVITEGSLLHLDQTTDRWLDRTMPFGRHILGPIKNVARRIAHIKSGHVDIVYAVQQWAGRPALVIQGERDRLIPLDDAKQISDLVGCELWIVPDARHAHCYRQARKVYLSKVIAVIEHCSTK